MTEENVPTPDPSAETGATAAPEPVQAPVTPYEPPAPPVFEPPAPPLFEQPAPPVFEPPAAPQPPAPPPGGGYVPGPHPAVGSAPAQWPAAYPAAPPPGASPVAYATPAPTSSNAVIALVLAVASWAFCPIIAAVVALVFASNAAKEIAASGGRVQGQGLVTAARIVSWINIGVMAAGLVIFAFVFILLAVAGGMNTTN